jgi:hypothetical protein
MAEEKMEVVRIHFALWPIEVSFNCLGREFASLQFYFTVDYVLS